MKYRQHTIKRDGQVYLVQRNGVTLHKAANQQKATAWVDARYDAEASQYRSTGRRYQDNACEIGMR